MKAVRKNQDSQKISTRYSCNICKDTGWVEGPKGYRKCECVVKETSKKQWEDSGLNPKSIKNINEYKVYDNVTRIARDRSIDYSFKFSEIKKEENNWIIFLGQPGAGKSHLTKAIGMSLLNKGYKTIYMPYAEVIQQLKGNAVDIDKYSKVINKFKNAEVLIIDDLFKDKVKSGKLVAGLTEVDIKHIYPLLNYRYNNNLATIISSECNPDMLIELDEAIGSRIIEKAAGRITVFKDERYNYRFRNI